MTTLVVFIVMSILFVVFLFVYIWAKRYVKVGPNEVLVVSGRRKKMLDADGMARQVGFRMVQGGGTFVWPVLERYDILSLELMTLEPRCENVYTVQGVPVTVNGVAQVKVRGDDISISTSSEQFLSKGDKEIHRIALETLEGHLRAIVGMMTVEDIYKNRDAFAQRVQDVAAGDMANMGVSIVSFTIKEICDPVGYLEALGKPRIAEVQRDATIAQAEAERDSVIKSAQANQLAQEAKFKAETRIAEAKRDYDMSVATYQASVNQKKAESDLAYDLQKFKTNQLVRREEIQVQVVAKEMEIEVQNREIDRKAKELQAVVERPADAELYRIRTLAGAEQYRLQTEAAGRAEAVKAEGFAGAEVCERRGRADAEAQKAQGLAHAEVTKAQGFAEAEAMQRKAASWGTYNEAAILEILFEKLPGIIGAVADPLSKTKEIVVVSSGGDGAAGTSKITKDIGNIIAQVPPIIKALSGVDLKDIAARIPGFSEKPEVRPTEQVEKEK